MTEGEPKKPAKKTEWKNVFVGRNPDTGKPYFERRKVTKPEPGEMPPDELDGLSKTPPARLGRVTPEQLEKSAKKGWPTFIDKSQPTGDKD